ncbi:hypothetical protein PHSY_005761 [Pseudozyma hubeiensis SY62]|uniref:CCZ1/INTU/HSP4 first Longin domain-containing protein n=1 Tax=Pseudozyma hubeiensis (strain SY62) TaxID=1305764 RepID=R9PA88_PSEHS|nr:hypothetical protein PHSY_005761 [Pseudozyma hubeiensis SY62]GAC98172.1 hypothetical protein PHSY_005761 [Pseudozyma hubeiensis SY62]
MSFLPSFSSLGASTASPSTSSSHATFKPASLSYFTIFCPALKPAKRRSGDLPNEGSSQSAATAQEEAEDEDARETAREAAQILFYTSRARAALKDRMLRQIGVAKGMIEFCKMVSNPSLGDGSDTPSKGRSWNVHSSKRRMVLIEAEPGIWVHASIDLPYTVRTTAEPNAKQIKEHHDALLPDVWVEESIRRAWRDWVLLNGCPAHVLSQKAGRAGLERSLEKYFSVWTWSWDLELATNADVVQSRGLFTDCVDGFPVVARAPRSKLAQLMDTEAAQGLNKGKHGQRDVVVLLDTLVLWPPTDAGCLDSEDEREDADESGSILKRSKSSPSSHQVVDPQTKADLLRRVASHLTGLERERDLIRAASASSTSDGRKRGTSGAIRERGTSGSKMSKRDMRNELLSASTANKKRVVSSPAMQQRSTSASSFASSTTADSTKWSNWGSMFSGLGKLGFRGNADTSAQSEATNTSTAVDASNTEPEAADISTVTSDLSAINTGVVEQEEPSSSSPIEALTRRKDAKEGDSAESSSPLHFFQQRLADAIPIQEAGGKMWNGAELAFRGIGASLGLANVPVPDKQENENNKSALSSRPAQDGDVSESDRFADASFDTNGADLDASVVTKVSILEPEVDVSELAEALGADEDRSADLSVPEATPLPDDSGADLLAKSKMATEPDHPTKPSLKLDTAAVPVESSGSDPISPPDESRASDAASIKTSASAKAFPSISVTSAAWYNTKALRSNPAAASPKHATAASIFSSPQNKLNVERREAPDPVDTSLSGVSVQSEHHDFELDGWGHEQPQPFQTIRCYVGESDEPISHETLTLLQKHPFQSDEYRISFTTRRLLTLVLIEKVPSTTGSTLFSEGTDTSGALEDAWQVLRRTQRILNDHDRIAKSKGQDGDSAVRFLHVDGPTLTFQSSLEEEADKMEPDVRVVAEAHCTSAMELMRRHGVVETFSRSSNGKTWTASRQGASKGTTAGAQNQTYMVLAGKKISIVDCDNELRKLANQYPSFGI